jgi:hypothetical protein
MVIICDGKLYTRNAQVRTAAEAAMPPMRKLRRSMPAILRWIALALNQVPLRWLALIPFDFAGQDEPGCRSVVRRAQAVLNDHEPRALGLADWIEDKPLTGSEVWSTACLTRAGRPGDQREKPDVFQHSIHQIRPWRERELSGTVCFLSGGFSGDAQPSGGARSHMVHRGTSQASRCRTGRCPRASTTRQG